MFILERFNHSPGGTMKNPVNKILFVVGCVTLSTSAVASSEKCGKNMNILAHEMELTSDQRQMLRDLKEIRRDLREDHKEHRHNKGQWMQNYLDGEVDRGDIHEQIDESHAAKYSSQQKMQRQLWDVLESYDEAQQEQLLDNIAEKRKCLEDKKEAIHSRGKSHKERQFNALTKDLKLTKRQQRALDEIVAMKREHRQQMKEDRQDHKTKMIEDFASGDLNRFEATRHLEEKSEENLSFRHDSTDQWLDFIDGLSRDQQRQLEDNLHEMEERRSEHRSPRR